MTFFDRSVDILLRSRRLLFLRNSQVTCEPIDSVRPTWLVTVPVRFSDATPFIQRRVCLLLNFHLHYTVQEPFEEGNHFFLALFQKANQCILQFSCFHALYFHCFTLLRFCSEDTGTEEITDRAVRYQFICCRAEMFVPNWQQFARSERILQAIGSPDSCIELARRKKFAKSSQGRLKNSNRNFLIGWKTELLHIVI